ncbi:hypothetical protein LJR009_002310 [Bosea sp. LjRoot9]|uniref:hypothetical protein n=1 Tax=Bosea sp. LjRoot9 TaxID=3342341 RepID=UPI003ECE2F65
MVHIPDAVRIRLAGYPGVVGVPVIFLGGYRYPRELNLYIRLRANGDWHPAKLPRVVREAFGQEVRLYTKKSMVTLARHLLNFMEWAEWAGVDWRRIEYKRHLVQGYQRDMQMGRWSARGEGLAPNTINQRISTACHFLEWAGFSRFRERFDQARIRISSSRSRGKAKGETVRLGAVRQDPLDLRLPTAEEVARWLKQVRARYGRTKALLCQTVLETAVRRDEAVEWRTSYLPDDTAEWRILGDYAVVQLVHGTKYGVARNIRLRMAFAEELHRYQRRGRLRARAEWIERNPNKKPPSRLFLSEYIGEPISYQVFYEAWVGVPALPFKGWSPHAGRHYWACTTLLEHLELQAQRARLVLNQMPDAWVHEVGLSAIQTIIQPQLGHASDETTERYLKWIHESIAVSDAYLGYHCFLDEDEVRDLG